MDGPPPLGLSERERSLIFPNGLAIMQIRGLHSTPRMAHSSSRDPLFHACHDLQCITPTGREREAIARPSADFGNGRVRGRLRPPPKLHPRDS